jgi:hypothetical protein
MADTVYKIRDRETGLFSTGGEEPEWTGCGKAWAGTGPLRAHLTLIAHGMHRYGRRNPYDGADVVAFQFAPVEVPVSISIADHFAKRKAAHAEDLRRRDEWRAERDRAEYEAMKARFEGA